jgi:hypothetical protein
MVYFKISTLWMFHHRIMIRETGYVVALWWWGGCSVMSVYPAYTILVLYGLWVRDVITNTIHNSFYCR